ncbi:hypothetical protein MTO96_027099 [Rhipicephalus appendiculatus]|uniref:Lipocalin n=1 Tax=Rhipicephalus appendiculatus TaxID=34631 RepID=A0A131YDA9_RHIAP
MLAAAWALVLFVLGQVTQPVRSDASTYQKCEVLNGSGTVDWEEFGEEWEEVLFYPNADQRCRRWFFFPEEGEMEIHIHGLDGSLDDVIGNRFEPDMIEMAPFVDGVEDDEMKTNKYVQILATDNLLWALVHECVEERYGSWFYLLLKKVVNPIPNWIVKEATSYLRRSGYIGKLQWRRRCRCVKFTGIKGGCEPYTISLV